MRQLVNFLTLIFLAAATSGSAVAPTDDVRQVFLIQNSGWMEPFYEDPRSPLKPFMNALIGRANLQGVDIVVASFNQDGQVEGRRSPEVRYVGPYDAARVREAIDSIDLPRKASGAYADADFRGALLGTFERILQGRQGVIWLVTNNKDAPDNNPAVIENTRAFYHALRDSPHITAIAAFPMRRVVTGTHFREKGLIFYAIAYGDRGRAALSAILRDGAPIRTLFPSPPVRLKPLDEDPVDLLLTSQTDQVEAGVRGGRLFISGVPAGGAIVRLHGRLRNSYYPQNVEHARLEASFRAISPELAATQVRMQPAAITDVPANGESGPVQLELRIPDIPRPPGLSGWFEDERVVTGELVVRLESLDFSLDPEFVSRISAISGGETIRAEQAEAAMDANLPEVFLDYRRVSSASMTVPVQIRVSYSPWPLILAIGLGALLLTLAAALGIMMTRPRTYMVPVGHDRQRVSIKPRERRTIADAYGSRAEVIGRLFGPPSVRPIEPA